jgi:hypothetical protein
MFKRGQISLQGALNEALVSFHGHWVAQHPGFLGPSSGQVGYKLTPIGAL